MTPRRFSRVLRRANVDLLMPDETPHARPQCLSACAYLGLVLGGLIHGIDRDEVPAAGCCLPIGRPSRCTSSSSGSSTTSGGPASPVPRHAFGLPPSTPARKRIPKSRPIPPYRLIDPLRQPDILSARPVARPAQLGELQGGLVIRWLQIRILPGVLSHSVAPRRTSSPKSATRKAFRKEPSSLFLVASSHGATPSLRALLRAASLLGPCRRFDCPRSAPTVRRCEGRASESSRVLVGTGPTCVHANPAGP